jgi:hypothetical protein
MALFIFPILACPVEGNARDAALPDGQGQAVCTSKTNSVKAVSTQGVDRRADGDIGGVPNFTHNGELDDIPLLITKVKTSGKSSCLIAHFSAYAQVWDNALIFQVLVDEQPSVFVPMEGHAPSFAGFSVPVVSEPNYHQGDPHPPFVNAEFSRMAAANFFKAVGPGEHTVKVLIAACCGDPTAKRGNVTVDAAVLTLEYNK